MRLSTMPLDDLFPLDPHAADVLEEGRRLRERGPLVPVILDGGVRAWATGHREVAEAVLGGRQWRKDPYHWRALADGTVPQDWGILEFITLPGLLNEDGDRHRELRNLVGKAFTPRRVEDLRPRVNAIAAQLVTDLETVQGQQVDLRHRFAFELPMQIICALFGLDPSAGESLARDYTAIHDSRSTPADVAAGKAGVATVISALIAEKRANPGDDLTTALISATGSDAAVLDDALLIATLMLFLFAGHETTQNLITNALKALSEHPEQLEALRSGEVSVGDVVEETLRWNGPINTIMFRYAATDTEVPGTGITVAGGDPVVICVAATGRDATVHGPTADVFVPGRDILAQHLAFGHGAHYCIGAPLARMTAQIAITQLLDAYDIDRTLAAGPIGSYSSNSTTALWAELTPRTQASVAA
ncbi:cytochrome P450 [Streptomyces sp. WI03-5b]|uniref:cytochrome P450 n=1 Tax=Streptomyces sp. WI03-5b TaxID=462946 RepID=UPI0029AD8C9C|nr:cytochrome P450 [Streptomyces sp. WI03-5b]MDX2622703.1 cytochrome P450 [Streptomyces sp. WI03-5b]